MPIDGVKGAEMSDYTYRKIIIDRDGVATGEKIINVPDELVKQIRVDAIDEFARKLYEGCNEMIETCGSNIAPISWAEAYADFKVDIEEIAERLKEQKK